jgi:hypothetical protein
MPTPFSSSTESGFFRLPLSVRQKIYTHLLSPQPGQPITTINYTLEWPFLQNPRNSTFTPHSLDVCCCAGQQPRSHNIQTKDHVYTRYICQGPEVRFTPKAGELWVLEEPNVLFNILRPASYEERKRRPGAGIILVNKQCYEEALSFLYSGTNFLFLTGPCPRGRYQAYATQKWLERLSPFARGCITDLSLICQTWEEDCQNSNAVRAYTELSRYISSNVPNLRNMCLNHWSQEILINTFGMLLWQEGRRIFVSQDFQNGSVEEFDNVEAWIVKYVRGHGAGKGKKIGHRRGNSDPNKIGLGEGIGEKARSEGEGDSKEKRRLSLADDWVLAGLSPTGPGSSDSDVWEVI